MTLSLGLTSHSKDMVVNGENKLHELVCDYLNHHYAVLDKVFYQGVFIPPTKISEGFYTPKNKNRGFLYLHSKILVVFMCRVVT